MPHFFFENSLFFGSRSQSSGDFAQDVSLCNQQDLGALWAIFLRSLASLPPLSASNCLAQPQFDPLGLNSVCPRCRHSASEGALIPGVLSQLRRPHALRAPCLTPISRLRRFRLTSGWLHPVSANQSLPTSLCQPVSANLSLPTSLCQPPSASTSLCLNLPLPQPPSASTSLCLNLSLPQAPSFTACARARTRRFSSSRGSAASARSSAIRE